jgi:hypothetical protein
VYEIVLEKGYLTKEQLENILSPERLSFKRRRESCRKPEGATRVAPSRTGGQVSTSVDAAGFASASADAWPKAPQGRLSVALARRQNESLRIIHTFAAITGG